MPIPLVRVTGPVILAQSSQDVAICQAITRLRIYKKYKAYLDTVYLSFVTRFTSGIMTYEVLLTLIHNIAVVRTGYTIFGKCITLPGSRLIPVIQH